MPPIKLREAKSHTLDQHVALIKRVIRQSMRDPESRMLAVKIVSGAFDAKRDARSGQNVQVIAAWGKAFRAPPGPTCESRDDACEVERVWDFIVLNMRYVYDPAEDDLFQTLKVSLLSGGGDCDDMTIAFATLLNLIGFRVVARVIATKDAPNVWAHIYPVVGLPKDNPTRWVPLDATVKGYVPGDYYKDEAKHRDFLL